MVLTGLAFKGLSDKHEAELPSQPHQMLTPLTLLEAQPARQGLERHWSRKVNPC